MKNVARSGMPPEHFMTGRLGQALADQNARTRAALSAAGVRPLSKSKRADACTFEQDERTAARMAAVGSAIAGDDGRPAIVWPDFKVLEAEWKAARVVQPMPENVKVRLREARARNPQDRGDEIAVMLRVADSLDDLYAIAAKYLGVTEKELRAKYGKLNPGMQRMNCGNRMRGKWKHDHGAAASVPAVDEKTIRPRVRGIRATGKVRKPGGSK